MRRAAAALLLAGAAALPALASPSRTPTPAPAATSPGRTDSGKPPLDFTGVWVLDEAASRNVSPMCMPETSTSRCCGISSGSASTFTSFVTCERTPPSLTPAGSPVSTTATAEWIG